MKKYLLIAALAVFSSTAVMADDMFGSSDDNGGGTIYGGVTMGRTKADCAGTTDCKSTNWKILAGYDVTSNIAVEGAYHNMLKKDSIKLTGISASGLYKLPVSDDFEAFGKAGFMAWDSHNSTSNDGTDVLLGAGATYKIDDNWGIRGEYEHVGGDLKANMYSLGATFSSF